MNKKVFAAILAFGVLLGIWNAPVTAAGGSQSEQTAAETQPVEGLLKYPANPFNHLKPEEIIEIEMGGDGNDTIVPTVRDTDQITEIVRLLQSIPFAYGQHLYDGMAGYYCLRIYDTFGTVEQIALEDEWRSDKRIVADQAAYEKVLEELRRIGGQAPKKLNPIVSTNFDVETACYLSTDPKGVSMKRMSQSVAKVVRAHIYQLGELWECDEALDQAEKKLTVADDNQVLFDLYQKEKNDYILYKNTVFLVENTWAEKLIRYYKMPGRMETGLAEVRKKGLHQAPNTGKPVIYLYPQKQTEVSVGLAFDGELTYTYPKLQDGWQVTAYPDGRLVNKADDTEHYYLFWEGKANHAFTQNAGFVVKGEDTESFLREKLAYLGLTPREYNDFIVYWVPQMQENAYNLITFTPKEEYERVARLSITPKPDSILRVHMAWKPLTQPANVPKQNLKPFVRTGFTVVEWGGTKTE